MILYPHSAQFLLEHIGTGEFFGTSEIIKIFGKDVCIPQFHLIDGLCEDVLFLICGFDPDNINIVSITHACMHVPYLLFYYN